MQQVLPLSLSHLCHIRDKTCRIIFQDSLKGIYVNIFRSLAALILLPCSCSHISAK